MVRLVALLVGFVVLVGIGRPSGADDLNPLIIFPAAFTARDASCDYAYPTVCIPSPPPDLDCPQLTFEDFVVLPPDPHGFDADKDGVGCESE